MKKRVLSCISIILFISAIVWMIIVMKLYSGKEVKSPKEGDITRYEWLELLCENQGMTEFENKTPYYDDVDTDSRYFSYVQSAVEWDLLDSTSHFDGDKLVSGKYIALTALRAIEEEKIKLYLESDEDITEEVLLDIAVDTQLVEKKQFSSGFTKKECEEVLNRLNDLYFGEFWKDDYCNVKYRDGVMELSSEDVLANNESYTELEVSDSVIDSVKVGSVVITKQKRTGYKIARKVTDIRNNTLVVERVQLEEVLKSAKCSDITEITFDDIIGYYGLENDNPELSDTLSAAVEGEYVNTKIFNPKAESEGYTFNLSGEDNCIKVTITDNKTKEEKELPIKEEIPIEGKYNAAINVDRIMVGAQIDFSAFRGLKYADVAVDAHATMNSEFEVPGLEKKFAIFETPAPLGNGLVGVNIKIYLVITVDGSIKFEAEVPMENSFSYSKGKGIRSMKRDISVENPSIQVDCEAGEFLRVEPVLTILDCFDKAALDKFEIEWLKDLQGVNIFDIEFDVGAVICANQSITRENAQICMDMAVSYPVVKFAFCNDEDANSLCEALEWKTEEDIVILSAENAPIRFTLHIEILPNGQTQVVQECTYKEPDTDPDSGDETNTDDNQAVNPSETADHMNEQGKNGQQADSGFSIEQFYGCNLPLFFEVTYSDEEGRFLVSEEGEYVVLKGSLIFDENVDGCPTTEEGETFYTASRRAYVVKEYREDDQGRGYVTLIDEDGTECYINNTISPQPERFGRSWYLSIDYEGGGAMTVYENVTLKLKKETKFTEGICSGVTLSDWVKMADFTDPSSGLHFDFGFDSKGNVNVLDWADIGLNGYGGKTAIVKRIDASK